MNTYKLYSVIAALLLVLIVILQNSRVVTLRVLFWNASMSGILLYLILLVVGFSAGYMFARMARR